VTKSIDLTGKTFNQLTIIHKNGTDKYGKPMWFCECTCGNTKTILGTSIRNGSTKSCGCLRKKQLSQRVKTHGLSKTVEYKIWKGIKKRCFNSSCKAFPNYGGRGITICDIWKNDAQAFIDYIGSRPSNEYSIERINNNKNYEPGNIKWATRQEQNGNQRSNRLITIKDKTKNVAQWGKISPVATSTIYSRLNKGWPPEDAVFKKSTTSH